jgi:hypothetical protein
MTNRLETGSPFLRDFHIAAVADDPVPQLPEIMRLAWLLSVLNLDLPAYSDQVTPKSLPLVAALAMLPATMAAARTIALAPYNEAIICQAMQSWVAAPEKAEASSGFLLQWFCSGRRRMGCGARRDFGLVYAELPRTGPRERRWPTYWGGVSAYVRL